MTITWVDIVLPAAIGIIASLVAPWANWGVEKRKKKLEWRKGFINDCKRIVDNPDFNPDMFRENRFYSSLKPHLSKKLQEEVEEKRYTPGKVMGRDEKEKLAMKEFKVKKDLLDEIAILEQEWGLL